MSTSSEEGGRLLEPAAAADIGDLVALTRDCVAHMRSLSIDQWDEVYPDEAVLARDIAEGTQYVMREGGRLVACLALDRRLDSLWDGLDWSPDGDPAGAIHRVMVHPGQQGRGLAARLVTEAEAMAREQGLRSIRLDCFSLNPAALRLYEKLGYRRTGEAMMRKGVFVGFEKRV